jgi:hypothetical protein
LRWLAGTVWAIVGIVVSIGRRHEDTGFAFAAFALAAVQIILGFSNSDSITQDSHYYLSHQRFLGEVVEILPRYRRSDANR